MHHALRSISGQHAEQQGSKVDADWLRFDFTNPRALGPAAGSRRGRGEHAWRKAVLCRDMSLADTQKFSSVLFGEKYPDTVRVVSMGDYSRSCAAGRI